MHPVTRRGKFAFPFLFGRAFIEAQALLFDQSKDAQISLPFRKGFH